MLTRLILISILLAHAAQPINQPTNQPINQPTLYHINDICLHNTSVNLGTRTVLLNISTDFSDFTTCDVNIHLMDTEMIVKVEVLPRGSKIECGWLSLREGPDDGHRIGDGCIGGSPWYLNQYRFYETITIRLDGNRWLGSGERGHWFNYTLAIYGSYYSCDLETDECHNTKDACEFDDCFDGLRPCNFYCNSCDGKRICCNSYGEEGENNNRHLCGIAGMATQCLHKDMTCDNYTHCEDGSDEICGVTEVSVTEASVTVSNGAVSRGAVSSGVTVVVVMGVVLLCCV